MMKTKHKKLMIKQRHQWIFILLIGSMTCAQPAFATSSADFKEELPNAVVLEDGLVGGGTPSEHAIKIAADKGYKTVIDVRMPSEGTEKEKAIVQKYGLQYVNIPTSPDNLSRVQADKLNSILSEKGAKPAILHCATGNRAAAVWAVYRKFNKGETTDVVLAQASQKEV